MKERKGGRRRGEEWKHFRSADIMILQHSQKSGDENLDAKDLIKKRRSTTVCIHCGTTVSSKAGRLRSHLAQCKSFISSLSNGDALLTNQVSSAEHV